MKTVRARVVGARREPTLGAEPYRTTLDFARIFAEGAQTVISGYETSLLTEPLAGKDGKDAVVVILVKVPADKIDAVRTHGLAILDLWRRWGPVVLGMLRSA